MTATTSALKATLTGDMKNAMRSKDKERLATIRLILAAVKKEEVDTRTELTDEQILAQLDKMQKQRRESITQFEAADRSDLADKEKQELEIIKSYLPEQLSTEEVISMLEKAVSETGASSMRDMGKVMGILKPQLQGRTDMGAVSTQLKALLSA